MEEQVQPCAVVREDFKQAKKTITSAWKHLNGTAFQKPPERLPGTKQWLIKAWYLKNICRPQI